MEEHERNPVSPGGRYEDVVAHNTAALTAERSALRLFVGAEDPSDVCTARCPGNNPTVYGEGECLRIATRTLLRSS